MSQLYVLNSGGQRELFSLKKVYVSVKRAGASSNQAEKIAKIIARQVYPGIKTNEIFRKIIELLGRDSPSVALRFNLKEGMKNLGPSGFPFEKFVAEIFKQLGFEVKLNQYLDGFCLAGYEIDFLAKNQSLLYIGECKYRNLAGEKVHLEDVLANQARFLDLVKNQQTKRTVTGGREIKSIMTKSIMTKSIMTKSIMVTNAKFTDRAIQYATCSNIDLLGWRWPKQAGLESLIEKYNLYPVTILRSLQNRLKDAFVAKEIMLVKDILESDIDVLAKKLKISVRALLPIIEEARLLAR